MELTSMATSILIPAFAFVFTFFAATALLLPLGACSTGAGAIIGTLGAMIGATLGTITLAVVVAGPPRARENTPSHPCGAGVRDRGRLTIIEQQERGSEGPETRRRVGLAADTKTLSN
jgi:hypothetical protein